MVKTVNPATGEVLREYAFDKSSAIEAILTASSAAFFDWSRVALNERLKCVEQFELALKSSRESLARSMTLEMGKPIKQSLSEIDKCVASCAILRENYPQWRAEREYSTALGHSVHCAPLGSILGIMPWNFPLWQVVRYAIPALLGGNTILLKHAPNTWGSSQLITELFQSSFPKNVFAQLLVDVPMIEKIIADARVRGVSLTGSTRAGRSVGELCGRYLKKFVLELGGSDAYLVFEDADVNRAAQICAEARLVNNGQSCVAAKRFIVHKNKLDEFTTQITAHLAKKRVGDPMQESTDIGPLARLDLRDGLAQQVSDSLKSGARAVLGGSISSGKGFFYPPTVLTQVKSGQKAFDEELFGPVAAVIEADSDKEAIRLANQSAYGLGGAIFSRDIERAKRIALKDFDTGMVFINDFVRSDALVPFGGVKDSGIGRELGREGAFEFINFKLLMARH